MMKPDDSVPRDSELSVEKSHPENMRELLMRLDVFIREAERTLGVTAADLPELTEEDHDRLALERINYQRTRGR